MPLSPEYQARLNRALRNLLPRDARYLYWETPDGRRFVYTTERLGDGKFASGIYVPVGKGSRSGRQAVTALKITREVHHATRRAANRRAYRLYMAWRDRERP